MSTNLLSTGKVAKIRSVTPDTVLKWIKSGKLQAQRTAGGHYRVHPEELNKLASINQHYPIHSNRASAVHSIQYCWEYNGNRKTLRECRECSVYQMRAQRCYEVIRFAPEIGHKKLFCKEKCEACEYYRLVREKPIGVLIVTERKDITASFEKEAEQKRCSIEIADCGYMCSSIIETFRPDYVVIDCSVGLETVRHIRDHIKQDPRIPYARVIIADEKGKFFRDCDKEVFACIEQPFNIRNITEFILSSANRERIMIG